MSAVDEKETIQQYIIGQEVRWSKDSFGIDEVAFDELYGRLEVLEALGCIRIVDYGHESYTGQRLFSRVTFQRLQ